MVNAMAMHFEIVFCTGRRESCRKVTRQWLIGNGVVEYSRMLMRPDGDHRHDTILKPELLEKAGISLFQILLVIEDRVSMVRKWRELELVCLQVAEGDF